MTFHPTKCNNRRKTQSLMYKPIPLIQISDYNMTPDVACLAEGLRTCLQESDEVPTDYTQLFHTQVNWQGDSSTHEQYYRLLPLPSQGC